MSKYLITGCAGFIGHHLAESLCESGHQVFGTFHRKKIEVSKTTPILCDFTNHNDIQNAVKISRPDVVYHLAAQSNIMESWRNFNGTMTTNVSGTYYLLEAIREFKLNPKIMIAGSSSEYGSVKEDAKDQKEGDEFRPGSPYALSKVCEDLIGQMYFDVFKMRVVRVIPFYTIGPRKEPDAPSDFAKTIRRCQVDEITQIKVGNLNVIRDVVDVRDAIRALRLLEEKGIDGTSYNLCTGKEVTLQAILKTLIELSGTKLEIVIDPEKFRPGDMNKIVGNPDRLMKLGWRPRYSLKDTLTSVLDFWLKEPVRS